MDSGDLCEFIVVLLDLNGNFGFCILSVVQIDLSIFLGLCLPPSAPRFLLVFFVRWQICARLASTSRSRLLSPVFGRRFSPQSGLESSQCRHPTPRFGLGF
jgi:hypothetical protein